MVNMEQNENGINVDEGLKKPLSVDLTVDKELVLSNKTFPILLNACNNVFRPRAETLKLEPFPADKTMALFAFLVYCEKENPTHKEYEKSLKKLPEEWMLLTTASNTRKRNRYFGAAFLNAKLQQVVVAHRGTVPSNYGSWHTNLWGIFWNKNVPSINSAVTFTAIICKAMNKANKINSRRFQLSLTGHSMGGWLAQPSAFTAKHIQNDCEGFVKLINDQEGFLAHTVVFDNPGCKAMMNKLTESAVFRYNRSIALDRLDITCYLSAPNLINVCNLHLGAIYRVITDLSDMNCPQWFTPSYNLKAHDMENMLKALEGTPTIEQVVNWPRLGPWLDTSELSEFIRKANLEKKFHPKSEEGEYYNTIPFDSTVCNLRIFSQQEQSLLETWSALLTSKFNLDHLDKLAKEFGFEQCDGLLPSFTIDKEKNTLKCSDKNSLDKVIRHCKQLIRWFPQDVYKTITAQVADVPTAVESIVRAKSENYLISLPKSQVDFLDSVELKVFLTSCSERILFIQAEDSKFQVTKLHNIFKQIKDDVNNQTDSYLQKYLKDKCQTFLEWRQLRELDKLVNIESILKSNTSFDNLLVIEYQSEGDSKISDSDREFLESVFKTLEQTDCKKMVLISSHSIILPGRIITTKQSADTVKITDLTMEAREILLEKNVISLQGTKISLAKLTGIQKLDNESSITTFNGLIDSDKLKQIVTATSTVLHIGKVLPTLSDLEVTYTTPVEKVTNLQQLHTLFTNLDANASERPYFVISGVINDREASEFGWKEIMEAGIGKVDIELISTFSELLFKELVHQFPDHVINWLHSTAGHLRWQQIYNPGFYIPRQFLTQLIIDNTKISKSEDGSDLFVFRYSKDKKSLMKSLNIKNEKDFFKNSCIITSNDEDDAIITNYYLKNIHFFTVEERDKGRIVWQRSVGSLHGLRPFLKHDESRAVSEEQLCDGSSKLVILADEPGMGKSTSLTRVSGLIKSSWVIRVDFKHFQQPISELPYDVTIDNAVKFLLTESTSGDDTERNLLKHCLQTDTSMQIYLLFDGFDEIQEIQSGEIIKKCAQEKVARLLRFLKNNTKANILVTTRKYPSHVLENELSVFATKFKKVDVEQQKAFFVKFWRCHLALQPGIAGERDNTLQQCAISWHRKAVEILSEDIASFMGIPLQMRMMAEVSLKQVRLCVESAIYREIDRPFHNVFELYESFINTKYVIYLKDKSGFSIGLNKVNRGWFERELTKKHRVLAFRQLFPDLATDFLGTELTDEEIIELNRVGLIQSGGDGTVEFTHRTFAEYFTADLLVYWLRKPRGRHSKYPSTEEILLFKLLLDADYKVCRQFVDDHLQRSSPALWNNCSQVARLWGEKKKRFFNPDHQTALHVAVQENRDSIIGYLVGGFEQSASAEDYITFVTAHDLSGDTALALAAKNKSTRSVEKLLMHMNNDVKKKIILSTVFTSLKNEDPCPHIDFIIEFTLKTDGCWKLERGFVQRRWVLIKSVLGAAKSGELPILQEALNKIEDQADLCLLLSAADHEGATALHIAAKSTKSAQFDIVQCLQEKHADIDAIDCKAMTPLLHASNLKTVEFLISHDADFMHCDLYNMTSLARAAKSGHRDIVEYLYDRKPDLLNIPNVDLITPLQHAAKGGHMEVVEFLLQKGADINVKDKFGMSALSWAAKRKRLAVLEFLLTKEADINQRDRYEMSTLQIAIKASSWEVAKVLVKKGAEINSADWNGVTALQRATRAGSWKLVQQLLDYGADVKATNSGICILHYAVKANKPDIVKKMIRKGADINQRDRYEMSPLQIAINASRWEVAKYLVAQGAEINSADVNGVTALQRATKVGKWELVQQLLDCGADVKATNSGICILHYAVKANKPDIVKQMIQRGADIGQLDEIQRENLRRMNIPIT